MPPPPILSFPRDQLNSSSYFVRVNVVQRANLEVPPKVVQTGRKRFTDIDRH
jgi:hypothetical protein